MPTWKKIIVSGSNAHLSTVTASAFSASVAANTVGFFGTASWAQSASVAISASALAPGTYPITASWATNAISASFLPVGTYNITASWAQSASQALTASFLPVGTYQITASWAQSASQAVSSSHAVTASFALNVTTPTSVVSSSLVQIFDSSSANGTFYPTFVNATSGHPSQSVDTDLTYVPSTNTLSAGNITLSGDIAVNGGDITTTATTFNLLSGATAAINIGASSTNVAILGNLEVRGSTTTVSSSNLLVADRFILLASGSTSATDGGIVIQSGSNGSGFAYFLDAVTAPNSPRWGFTSSFLHTDGAPSAIEFAVSARTGSGDPTGDPIYGGSGFGHGNIYVNGAGDIWIYS